MNEERTGTLILKPKRDKPVQKKHPWVFSGAIGRMEGSPRPGDLINIVSANKEWLAYAYYNPHSQIRGRILSWNEAEQFDESFWETRLKRAIASRDLLQFGANTNAYRLVAAESDGLPGLIVDKYANYLTMQCYTMGIDKRKGMLTEVLAGLVNPAGIIERSDVSMRHKEGLQEEKGVLWGKAPEGRLTILENGYQFQVDLLHGHKTGYYLDQRDNRALVGDPRFVAGKDVLNTFAYTGGFAVYAAGGGANSIINIDAIKGVLEQAEQNMAVNGFADRPNDEFIAGDAFEILRDYRDEGRQFDVVVLDPPKFAHKRKDVERACRGYKDINWLGMRLTRPGGVLATFSCSGLISADLFQKVLFGAAVDSGREVQIIHTLTQGADHPVLLTYPEAAYLKGFLCRVW